MYSLVEMLRYKRPQGSETQKEFCERFLEPVFGKPDEHGNFMLQIGNKPHICFTAHHDTVHRTDGMQKIIIHNNIVAVADSKSSNCLGADCTTGIYIIMCMIEAGIEGTYVIHAAEESGCKGSRALVQDYPMWLSYTKAVISFDRYGDNSVITHQTGMRTASDAFAKSFAAALNMPQLKPDNTGVYTDSNEYASIVPECTNISVGYYGQHGVNETQDLEYLDFLVTQLESADWSKLVFERDPSEVDDLYDWFDYRPVKQVGVRASDDDAEYILAIVREHPEAIAEMLSNYGFSPYDLLEECRIDNYYYNSYMDNYARRKYQ